jgi:hypothetical protein
MFEELIGEQLSAVTFVQDYLQLWFDGPGINVTSQLTIRTPKVSIASGGAGFRDLLCEQITKIVTGVDRRPGDFLSITFKDGSSLLISLRKEDCMGAEAYYAHGFRDNAWMVE